jgi:hypothetical protein
VLGDVSMRLCFGWERLGRGWHRKGLVRETYTVRFLYEHNGSGESMGVGYRAAKRCDVVGLIGDVEDWVGCISCEGAFGFDCIDWLDCSSLKVEEGAFTHQ